MTISMTRGTARRGRPAPDLRARREAALARLSGGTAVHAAPGRRREPNRIGQPARPDAPTHPGPSRAEPSRALPPHAEQPRALPPHAEPSRALPPHAGQPRAKPSRVKPSRRAVQRTVPKAVEQLGPAPGTYYAIVVIVAVFVVLGLVMVLSATSANSVGGAESPYATFSRQLVWAGFGLVGMLVALALPYQRWRSFVIPGAVLAAGAMMLPFVPGVGATINDANSWVRFGSFGFQPSELLKLAAIAFLADYFARHQDELHEPRRGVVPLALVAMASSGVSFIQGDLGSAIVLGAAILAVGVIAGVPFVHVGSMAMVGAIGAAAAIVSDPRRFNRLTAFRDIEGNKEHLAWQSWQGLLGIANGGLTGSGIGGSRAKMGYLPLAHSDFIFAVIADELGFIGSVAVIGGFALLVWFGIQTALAAPDTFGLVLAGGISVWFGVQAIVNIGGVAGMLPVTGLTLPFFSAGGTSLFVSMVAAGLLLNVARRAVTVPGGTSPTRRARLRRRTSGRASRPSTMDGTGGNGKERSDRSARVVRGRTVR